MADPAPASDRCTRTGVLQLMRAGKMAGSHELDSWGTEAGWDVAGRAHGDFEVWTPSDRATLVHLVTRGAREGAGATDRSGGTGRRRVGRGEQ